MQVAVVAVPAEAQTVPANAPTLLSKAFLKYALERALKTLVQVLVAVVGASQATGHVSLAAGGLVLGISVLASLCTSVVAATSTVPTE
jgi:hypothetical protein